MASAAAAKARPAAAHTAEMCAAAAHTSEVPAAANMTAASEVAATTATAASAAMTTASAAPSGCVDRARKRERKNNHGQDFELRHDNLLKPPGLTSTPCSQASLSLGKWHNWDDITPRRLNNA